MKKLLLVLAIVTVLFSATPVEAHFLATDGNVGAVLHVDPNDDPIAGSQASFFFEFKDKENKFQPQNCNCTFEIDENGTSIYSQLLFQNNSSPSLSNASVFYTFPQRDVYQVKVIGKPTTPNAFQSFTLTWNFRVDQQAPQAGTAQNNNPNFLTTHMIHIIVICLLIISFLAYIISNSRKNKKNKGPTVPLSGTMVGKEGGEKKDDKKDIGNMF